MAASSILSRYPWTKAPLIVGAPMGLFIASPSFAIAVTRAGGLGFMAAGTERETIVKGLDEAASLVGEANLPKSDGMLPVGIGFLLFASSLDGAAEAVRKHKPTATWLFGAKDLKDYATWSQTLRKASPSSHVWVQTGSVTDALQIAQTAKPDVLVCQGADAGGHGLENCAGVISLVPEIADALVAKGHGHIPLVAAGGIADGRGVAASVALGAVGAAMGTRFLASTEVQLTVKGYQQAILAATDGGQATIRDKVFDDLNPKGNIWPVPYDGRGIRNLTWVGKRSGTSIEENRKLQAEAVQNGDDASDGPNSRVTVWAGTGVGLVNRVQSATEVVEEVREQARKVLKSINPDI